MKLWKEASSLIIAAKSKSQKYGINALESSYSVLTVKRHANSSVLPNYHVFPGGHTDKADSSREWRKVFSQASCRYVQDSLDKMNQNVTLQIFKSSPEESLPRSISLRIAAIRETFEECGLLICKRFADESQDFDKHLQIESTCQWRQKVLSDPQNFIKLCIENKCYPNVMALNLWSNWMTPLSLPTKKFSVAFFLAVLDDCYDTIADQSEIAEIGWYPPSELLKNSDQGKINIIFPQFYELSRLLRFKDIAALSMFAKEVNKSDCEPTLPIICFFDSKTVTLLPGDDMYPENPIDYTYEEAELLKERIDQCNKRHRMAVYNSDPIDSLEIKELIVENVASKYSQILPLSSKSSPNKTDTRSKL